MKKKPTTKKVDGRRAKGRRVAKPKSPDSVSAARNGVTTAIFVQMTPDERRALDQLSTDTGVSRGKLLRGLMCAAYDKHLAGKAFPVKMEPEQKRGRKVGKSTAKVAA